MKMKAVLGLAAALAVAGCHIPKIDSPKIDYQAAQQTKPLEVPPDLSPPPTDDRYAIPRAQRAAPAATPAGSQPDADAAAAASARAKLARDDAGVVQAITLSENFERAWRRVGLALDRAGFTVENRDKDNGQYSVRYTDPNAPQKKEGMFAWMGFGKAKPPEEKHYRIQIKENTVNTRVEVLDAAGKSDTSDTAGSIMALLYEQLR